MCSRRLSQYVASGGTLLVADAHLTGPEVAALDLPQTDAPAEAYGYRWLDDAAACRSQLFRFRPIRLGKGRASQFLVRKAMCQHTKV